MRELLIDEMQSVAGGWDTDPNPGGVDPVYVSYGYYNPTYNTYTYADIFLGGSATISPPPPPDAVAEIVVTAPRVDAADGMSRLVSDLSYFTRANAAEAWGWDTIAGMTAFTNTWRPGDPLPEQFIALASVENLNSGFHASAFKWGNSIIFGFDTTNPSSFPDVITDISLILNPYEVQQAQDVRAFVSSVMGMYGNSQTTYQNYGWSLSGALATVAALQEHENGVKFFDVSVTTFAPAPQSLVVNADPYRDTLIAGGVTQGNVPISIKNAVGMETTNIYFQNDPLLYFEGFSIGNAAVIPQWTGSGAAHSIENYVKSVGAYL